MKKTAGIFIHQKHGQAMADYASIIGVVVAVCVAGHVFVQRIMARSILSAKDFVGARMDKDEYEPYYVDESSSTQSASSKDDIFDPDAHVLTVADATISKYQSTVCPEYDADKPDSTGCSQ